MIVTVRRTMARVKITCPYCGSQFAFDLLNAETVDYPPSGSATVYRGGGTAMPSSTIDGKAVLFRNVKCPNCGRVMGIDSDDL